ncbi:retrovirus-related pol polyprotein from transposon TNT 1-94 [Tanacetum coccineum]
MAKNANPLALVATAQTLQDSYYQTSKSHKSYAPTSKASLLSRSHATTRHKGKEIAKPITPPSELASEEDSDPEQAQKDKYMQKNLALIAKDTVGGQVVQQSGIQCFNCKEFGHFAKECRKPKRVKDSTYHKEKDVAKASATLTQELTECKSVLTETSRTLGESISIQDSCIVALQNKQTELEEYMAFNNRTVDYEKLEHKLNETLGLLAQKNIDIKEGLKVKAYEISVVQAKHDELVKQSLLTKSHYECLVKEKTKVITDLKLKEEKDIDKMISMEK